MENDEKSIEKRNKEQAVKVKEIIWNLLSTYKFSIVFTIISFIIIIQSLIFDLDYFENIYTLFVVFEEYQLDEFILILVLISSGFLIDIYINRSKVARKLKKLNKELEQRVAERTKELKESEEKYRDEYHLANFYKDLFAHDMSNILQAIISTVEYYSLIQNMPENLKKFGNIAEVIKTHATRGATLIFNVKKLSELDETETELKSVEIFEELNKSVDQAVSSFQDKNIKININGLSKDLRVLGNELLIEIFDNLLSNAVKYNFNEEEVKVKVIISKMKENDSQFVKFEFKDYGMGVPEENRVYLFSRPHKADVSKRGMGIGLSLVRKIVDKYDGKIWVEDRIQGDFRKGSNFVVLLKEGLK